jgi:hypothetical protein
MATMNVLDSTGATVAIEKPITPGQAAMAASRPVVIASNQSSIPVAATLNAETSKVIGTVNISSTQLAALNTTAQPMATGFQLVDVPSDGTNASRLGGLTESAPANDTASSGLNGRLQRIAQRVSSMIGLLPAALGVQGGLKVDDIFSQYETVAASASAQAMGATGAAGDYLAGVLVFPGAAACGVVTILDNVVTIGTFAGGGTTALGDLKPFLIPVGLYSVSGAWKITTGANVTAVGIGKFT